MTRVFLFILFYEFSAISSSENNTRWTSCPEFVSSDLTCRCFKPNTLGCAGQGNPINIRRITKRFKHDEEHKISLLDLTLTGLRAVPPRSFDGTDLNGLVLSSANLSSGLNASLALAGLEQTLRVLRLSQNELRSVPWGLASFVNLVRLDLSRNLIAIANEPISRSIQYIDLSSNRLSDLSFSCERVLPNLRTLHLDGNDLRVDQFRRFSCPQATHLTLSGNRIGGTLNATTFSIPGLWGSLTSLDLSSNAIEAVTSEAFAGLRNLTFLNLKNNSIEVIDSLVFVTLTGLTRLDLSENRLISLPDDLFVPLVGLVGLDLAHNHLQDFGTLRGLEGVETVNLEDNDIVSVKPGAVQHLTKIKTFRLAGTCGIKRSAN